MPTILAIDDRQDNLTSIEAILKNYISDLNLLKATSGKAGVLSAYKNQPDVIILDIIMPKMDGYEVCKKLRQNDLTKNIPVILLTAIDTSTENKIRGLEAGAEIFLAKPIDPGELAAQVKAMLRIKRAEDKLRAEKELLDKNVKERTRELSESEEKYRKLIETTSEGFWLIGTDKKTIDVNQSLCNMIGYSRYELIGKTPFDFVDDEDLKVFKEQTSKITSTVHRSYEISLKKKNGSDFPTIFNATSLLDKKGEPAGSFSFVTDITERKQAEKQIEKDLKEKSTLLRELYHRTKNNMQVISSMLRLRSMRTDEEFIHTTFKEINNKIKAMSLVQEKLYKSKNLSEINLKEYIEELIDLLRKSYDLASDRIAFQLELEDIPILLDCAVPLGLIINELISNAFKHAFPNKMKGEISIKSYKEKNGIINIHLEDNGVGIPADLNLKESDSIGLQTMFSLIEFQLKGEVNYVTDEGLKWHLKIKDNLYKKRV